MEKIKDITKLPDWFSKRVYKKQLSDIDWYREIRQRQLVLSLVNMHIENPRSNDESSLSLLNEMLERDDVSPDSLVYIIQQEGVPIKDLTVGETIFLSYSTQDSEVSEVVEQYQKILAQWLEVCNETQAFEQGGPTPLFGDYERILPEFLDHISEDDSKFECPIHQYSDSLMNPWLSYGRPLNGYPVTIDTQFDDETILQNVKEWLVKTREKEGTKATVA